MLITPTKAETGLNSMMNEWFPKGFTLQRARKFITLEINLLNGTALREQTLEHDKDFTPMMTIKAIPVFEEYERDYIISIHDNLRPDLIQEMVFTSIATIYLSYHYKFRLESRKLYVCDYVSRTSFNEICDSIRVYYHSKLTSV